ncbi:MAG: hypothetical protein IKL60_02465 [Alistipes sp.]|nr:hypothetical protein [Alistipes sp.]
MGKTVQLPFITILSYLSLIEQSVPNIDNFSLYTPSGTFNPDDTISVQKEAKRMMEFVGLNGYTTIVTLCLTKNGTAGSINLNNSKEVFIEIDKNMQINRKNYKEAVLCVMAHEICHKYLYAHGFYLEDNNINEYCTDLATFFVGFGLLTINGCYEEYSTTEKHHDGSSTTTTHIHSTGYLTPQNYFTAHQVVCKIHNVDYLKGVSIKMYRFTSQLNKTAIEQTQLSRESIIEKFKEQSISLANRKREIIILKNYLALKEKEMVIEYEENDRKFNRLVLYGNAADKLPFTFMHMLNLPQKELYYSEYSEVLDKIDPKYHELIDRNLLTLICPICGAVSNSMIRENGLSIRKCQCGKIFYWNSLSIASRAPKKLKIKKMKQSNSFTNWIKSIFKLRKL